MKNVIVVDLETTRLSVVSGGRVIEIGAVKMAGSVIVNEFSTLINPGTPICYSAYRVHGISEGMLQGAPLPQDAWSAFRAFVGDATLVAHNAPFDRAFVRHELARLCIGLQNQWHCTLRVARQKLKQLPNHKLDTVYRHLFGVLPENLQRHRALDDARMAAMVWVELMGKY